jgi:hypothetical protein
LLGLLSADFPVRFLAIISVVVAKASSRISDRDALDSIKRDLVVAYIRSAPSIAVKDIFFFLRR